MYHDKRDIAKQTLSCNKRVALKHYDFFFSGFQFPISAAQAEHQNIAERDNHSAKVLLLGIMSFSTIERNFLDSLKEEEHQSSLSSVSVMVSSW